jgi:hypothetical protein
MFDKIIGSNSKKGFDGFRCIIKPINIEFFVWCKFHISNNGKYYCINNNEVYDLAQLEFFKKSGQNYKEYAYY